MFLQKRDDLIVLIFAVKLDNKVHLSGAGAHLTFMFTAYMLPQDVSIGLENEAMVKGRNVLLLL